MRVVLDTGAFFWPEALRRLSAGPEDVIVPAVVFTERCRQLTRDGRRLEEFFDLLAALQFEVEPFDKAEGLRFAIYVKDDRAWTRLARDALIAGHVREDDRLWTANARDFLTVGVPPEQIVDLAVG